MNSTKPEVNIDFFFLEHLLYNRRHPWGYVKQAWCAYLQHLCSIVIQRILLQPECGHLPLDLSFLSLMYLGFYSLPYQPVSSPFVNDALAALLPWAESKLRLFCHPVIQVGSHTHLPSQQQYMKGIPGAHELLRWSQLLDYGQSAKDTQNPTGKSHASGVPFHMYWNFDRSRWQWTVNTQTLSTGWKPKQETRLVWTISFKCL